jgi:hypothetical protein
MRGAEHEIRLVNEMETQVNSLLPAERHMAMMAAVKGLRRYELDALSNFSDADVWKMITTDQKWQQKWLSETVRQIAQYELYTDTTETCYLKFVDPAAYGRMINDVVTLQDMINKNSLGAGLKKDIELTKKMIQSTNPLWLR